jgi:hypothetical protein
LKDSFRIVLSLLAVLPAAFLPSAHAQDGKAIVDALIPKGTLTQGDADQLIRDAAKSSAAPQVVPNAKATTKLALGASLQIEFDGLSTDVTNGPSLAYSSRGEVDEAKVPVVPVVGIKPTAANLTDDTYPISLTPALATQGGATATERAFIDFVRSARGQSGVAKAGLVAVK